MIKLRLLLGFIVFGFLQKTQPFASEDLTRTPFTPLPVKPWTAMIFIAGSNDLAPFVNRNIQQMMRVGSTDFINIVVGVIESPNKSQKVFRILLIEKNSIKTIFETTEKSFLDSGDPKNLSFFCKMAISLFPAIQHALFLWNHGTGPLDFQRGPVIRMKHLFIPGLSEDPAQTKTFSYALRIRPTQEENPQKGICFDDETGNNLSEEKLIQALNDIVYTSLGGKKLALIGCDACFMGSVEIASLFKSYADIMVGSEESEPGAGWNYERVFSPFLFGTINKETFGKHIVQSYSKTYHAYADHTLSCINLTHISTLESHIKKLSVLLQEALTFQANKSVFHAIATSKAKHLCTNFDEPSFIDLQHFCANLINNVSMIVLHNKTHEYQLKNNIIASLQHITTSLQQAIVANVAGSKYACAQGLSIYFPETWINRLYRKNIFSYATDWSTFLTHYHQHR